MRCAVEVFVVSLPEPREFMFANIAPPKQKRNPPEPLKQLRPGSIRWNDCWLIWRSFDYVLGGFVTHVTAIARK